MSNIPYFTIRNLQKKNIVNYVNNKKKYSLYKSKSKQEGLNRVITRKMHTNYVPHLSFGKGPDGDNGPKLPVFIMIAALSGYILYKI